MPQTTKNTVKEPILTVRIVPGKALPAQKQAWKRWWAARLNEAKAQLQAESAGQPHEQAPGESQTK